ncbi:hypothetical protein CsSME_00015145 [Camellia sinensis var. sinensis]
MDKASIIKDAIDYIQELHEQEGRIQAEIRELASGKSMENKYNYATVFDDMEEQQQQHQHQHHDDDHEQEDLPALLRSKKKRIDLTYDSRCSRASSPSPIEDLEVSLSLSLSQKILVNIIF